MPAATYTVGTDPELFLRDAYTGEPYPVCGLIGGTKSEPLPMEGLPDGFFLQEDNVMLEFNVPPSQDGEGLLSYMREALSYLDGFIRTNLERPAEFDTHCFRLMDQKYLRHPGAATFGCSPDFDAYGKGAAFPRVEPGQLFYEGSFWRFAGGHVHIGYPETDIPHFVIAQFADVFLGLPLAAVDKQGPRRQLYGKAGRYRPTKHGIEYRSLSNQWIWDDNLVYDVGNRAISLAYFIHNRTKDDLRKLYGEIPWSDVKEIIEAEDERRAADLRKYIRTDLGLEEA